MQRGLDHIILGVNDLDTGVAWVEQSTGVHAVFGGVHPARGTRNALLALGPNSYLEIMAPDPRQASPTWFTRILTLHEPKLIGWAVHTPDLAALAEAVVAAGFPIDGPHDGSRARPGGNILSWKLFRLREDRGGFLPLVLDWGDSIHPAQNTPSGCHLESFHLESPQPAELTSVFRTLGIDVRVDRAETSRMLARIASPRGEVELTS